MRPDCSLRGKLSGMVEMKVDRKGEKFLQDREGWMSTPYLCSSRKPTIGFGNTYYPGGRKVTLKDPAITKEYGIKIFREVLKGFERDVNSLVTAKLTQNQYNAILSFAYNVGTDIDADNIPEGLGDSTLLKFINKNPNDPRIAKELMKWINSNRIPNNGLIKRRKLEVELYYS